MSHQSKANAPQTDDVRIQEFLDMIAPSVIRFFTDYFICGNTYRSVWALREYPTATEEQAILRHLGEKDGVTLHIYTRHVAPVEDRKIISNAANKNRMQPAGRGDHSSTDAPEQGAAPSCGCLHRTVRS